MKLRWPRENSIDPDLTLNNWSHPSSNYCLDFHGDPVTSELKVFSDGNHHMALEETLEAFRAHHKLSSIFYCTTPPKVYLDWMQSGSIEIGNLRLSMAPDIVIAPDDIMERLAGERVVRRTAVFAQSLGNSFLVRKDNPKNIREVQDLLREDVKLFLSNPVTEGASHMVYRQTLEQCATNAGLAENMIENLINNREKMMFGELIHHREAPQAVADGRADVAVVYNHLAIRFTRIFPEFFDRVPLDEGEQNTITRYAIGLVDESCELACLAFQHFLSDATGAIYGHHGLQAAR